MEEFSMRMGWAFLMGMAVGVERQCRQRNAGLRTNVLVSVGSAAFTVLSCSAASGSGDPLRVGAQIVSGIGFIGGGLILKDGISVRGLNTAATIWCSAACGTLAGTGMYAESAVLVAFVLAAHCLLRPVCAFIERKTTKTAHYTVTAECRADVAGRVEQIILSTLSFDSDVRLNSMFHKTEGASATVYCRMDTTGSHVPLLDLVASRLRSCDGVKSAGWETAARSSDEF